MPLTIEQEHLNKVGFAGFIKIKIKQNTSGKEKTVDVPVSVVDGTGTEVKDDSMILIGYDFNDYVSNVPVEMEARRSYTVIKTKAIAWNYITGDPVEVLVADNQFITMNPMIAGEHVIFLAGGNLVKKIAGTIKNDPVTTVTGTAIPQIIQKEARLLHK